MISAAMIGWYLLGFFWNKRGFNLETLLIGMGLGLALLSYAIFGLMAIRQFSLPNLMILFSLWLAAGLIVTWQERQRLGAFLERATARDRGFWWMAALGLAAALLNLLPALMPSTDWDGLAYHLALLKIYLHHSGFVFRPDIFHNLFPQSMDMLFALGLFSPGGQAAKVVNLELGVLCALAVFTLARKLTLARPWVVGAGLLFYIQYIVHLESGTTFIELGLTFYVLLGLIALLNMKTQKDAGLWPALALFFFGMTAAGKWHGLIILTLGWLAVAVTLMTSAGRPAWAKTGLKLIGWGVLGALPITPYLLRNILFTGNPVWPLAFGLFGGPFWDQAMDRAVMVLHHHYAGWVHGWPGLWRLPYDLVAHAPAFSIGTKAFRWPLLASMLIGLGALMVRLGQPKAKAVQGQRFWVAAMVALVTAYLVFWFFSSPQFRFLLPLLPLWAVFTMAGLSSLWRATRGWKRLPVYLLAAGLAAFHPPVHWDTPLQLKVLFGRVSPSAYCSRALKHFQACRFLNGAVQPGEKVLLFGENRGFYLDKPYLWGDPLMQKVIDFRTLKSVTALDRALRHHRIAWVLYREDLYADDYYFPHAKILMKAFLARYGKVLFSNGTVKVYRLDEIKPRIFAAGLKTSGDCSGRQRGTL